MRFSIDFVLFNYFKAITVITLVVLNFYYFTDVDDDIKDYCMIQEYDTKDYCILHGSWGRRVAVVFI